MPTEPEVMVSKDLKLREGEGLTAFREALSVVAREHVIQKLNLDKAKSYTWVFEIYSTAAIVEVYQNDDGKTRYYAMSYSRDDKGNFELGALTEVQKVTSFVTKPTAVTKAEDIGETRVWKRFWEGVPLL